MKKVSSIILTSCLILGLTSILLFVCMIVVISIPTIDAVPIQTISKSIYPLIDNKYYIIQGQHLGLCVVYKTKNNDIYSLESCSKDGVVNNIIDIVEVDNNFHIDVINESKNVMHYILYVLKNSLCIGGVG